MEIIPEYLYKYRTFDSEGHWKDILLNRRLYMSLASNFNDPFEGQLFPFDTGTCGNSINLIAGKANKDVAQFLKNYRVLCLSGNIRNKAMWAYYADNYKGFALQFRTRKLSIDPEKINHFSNARRVIYKSDNEYIPCRQVHGYKHLKEVQRQCLLYKSADWKQEEEFRIIRGKNNKFFHFDSDDLVSVILGAKISEENKNQIMNLCQKLSIRCRQMWLVTIESRIEFYSDNQPRFDGISYKKYIDKDI